MWFIDTKKKKRTAYVDTSRTSQFRSSTFTNMKYISVRIIDTKHFWDNRSDVVILAEVLKIIDFFLRNPNVVVYLRFS